MKAIERLANKEAVVLEDLLREYEEDDTINPDLNFRGIGEVSQAIANNSPDDLLEAIDQADFAILLEEGDQAMSLQGCLRENKSLFHLPLYYSLGNILDTALVLGFSDEGERYKVQILKGREVLRLAQEKQVGVACGIIDNSAPKFIINQLVE